jgi:hypothetical protein
MATDPRLASAIAHWGARFVANGVALTDFEEVTRSLGSWDETGAGPGPSGRRCTRLSGARRSPATSS